MNVNNFISERSSTRLHAPPGGTSQAGSLIFGGPAPAGAAISSNKYANGSNQNCGNVMTGRSSTRLHAPPGGTSQAGSLIFGGGAPAEDRFAGHRGRGQAASSASYNQNQSSISFGSGATGAASAKEPLAQQAQSNYNAAQTTTASTAAKKGTSANAFASGTNQNCGNFITDRPTSRVLAPPGGRSSGPLW